MIDKLKQEINKIELIPVAAARAISLLGDSNAEVSELASIIESDPGLCMNILKQVNSAAYGFSGKIGSVKDAIIKLGFRKIREICILISCSEKLYLPIKGYDLPRGWLWSHLMTTAFAAEEIEKHLDTRIKACDVFTAGLFHDIGKILLGTFAGVDTRKIARFSIENNIPFIESERRILGTDHAEIGAIMLRHWHLPENIVLIAKHHHNSDKAPKQIQAGADIVHAADVVSMMTGIGNGIDGLNYTVSDGARSRLSIRITGFEKILLLTMDRLKVWEELLADEFSIS